MSDYILQIYVHVITYPYHTIKVDIIYVNDKIKQENNMRFDR